MGYLGIDVGTSAVKVGFMTRSGEWVVRSAPVAGADEALRTGMIDPREWWNATKTALKNLDEVTSRERVDSIGVIGNTPTLIFVDGGGAPVYPAILWNDTRATTEAKELLKDHPQEDWNMIYGGYMPVSAAYPSAKLRWMQRHEREVMACTAKILQPKDFVNFHLTGVMAGDHWTSKGLVRLGSGGRHDPLEALGLDAALAPTCFRPLDVIGTVTTGSSHVTGLPEGTPVMAGWSDTLGAVVSLGLNSGDGFILSGTSESIGILTQHEISNTSSTVLCAPVWDSGYKVVYGPTSSGLATLRWAETALALDLLNEAEEVPLNDALPLFVPFVLGQRSPIWNDQVRGAWFNVDIHTTREQLGAGVVLGVVAAERDVMEAVRKLMNDHFSRIVVTGGGSKIASLNEWRTAIFDVPLFHVSTDPVLGAALLAYWGLNPHDFPHGPSDLRKPYQLVGGDSKPSIYESYRKAKQAVLDYTTDGRRDC
ncbi:MAG: hypothetical protein C7B43_18750 [Sulfobacillus benefaciens]|uniref:Carbohydrate kinase n=1 Tax=Sulfobacillus benefaciens TaxID=453960 RepID=A0A2T2WQN3_9FIRM|nr:MAG: hypothetical protein C7B43_18750 [Sulfobacillus benefaciens]